MSQDLQLPQGGLVLGQAGFFPVDLKHWSGRFKVTAQDSRLRVGQLYGIVDGATRVATHQVIAIAGDKVSQIAGFTPLSTASLLQAGAHLTSISDTCWSLGRMPSSPFERLWPRTIRFSSRYWNNPAYIFRFPRLRGVLPAGMAGLMEDHELVWLQVEVYEACAVGGRLDWHGADAPVKE